MYCPGAKSGSSDQSTEISAVLVQHCDVDVGKAHSPGGAATPFLFPVGGMFETDT